MSSSSSNPGALNAGATPLPTPSAVLSTPTAAAADANAFSVAYAHTDAEATNATDPLLQIDLDAKDEAGAVPAAATNTSGVIVPKYDDMPLDKWAEVKSSGVVTSPIRRVQPTNCCAACMATFWVREFCIPFFSGMFHLFNAYLLISMMYIGVYSSENSTACDQPLAEWILVWFPTCLVILVTHSILFYWVRHSGNVLRYDLLEGHTTVPRVLVPLSAMLCVFSIAWLIVGNVWVFSATTCADTSAKQMHNWRGFPLSLYEATEFSVIYFDVVWLLINVLACFTWQDTLDAHDTRPGEPLREHAELQRLAVVYPTVTVVGAVVWLVIVSRQPSRRRWMVVDDGGDSRPSSGVLSPVGSARGAAPGGSSSAAGAMSGARTASSAATAAGNTSGLAGAVHVDMEALYAGDVNRRPAASSAGSRTDYTGL